jgi:hypothetical protein
LEEQQMNRKFFGLALALLSLTIVPPAALADGGGHSRQDRVKGSGQTGQLAIKVDAKGARKGKAAQGRVRFSDRSDPTSPLNFKGDVSCVDVVGGDAVVAGSIEDFGPQVDVPPDSGGIFYLYISDTGRKAAGPDRWSAQLVIASGMTPPDECAASPGFDPLDRGDFMVQDGDAAPGDSSGRDDD